MEESILFVDDESMVLNALERTVIDLEYKMFFATSAEEGMAILAKEPITMVVSDIRMTPVSGFEFLKNVRDKYPKVIRLVLSAFADRQMMIQAVVEGLTKVYLTKPWVNKDLVDQLVQVFALYRSIEKMNIIPFLDSGHNLPSKPEMYAGLQKMISENRDIKDMAAFIEKDPGCSANILKLVNSSFYGMKITTIRQAMVYLGINNVKDMVLIARLFQRTGNDIDARQRDVVIEHMITCSSIFHGLHLTLYNKKLADDFSTIGLLVDIGRFIMLDTFYETYCAVDKKLIQNEGMSLVFIETELFGFPHSQIGAAILDWWNFPAIMAEACMFHHGPFHAAILPKKILALVHVADAVAWELVEKKKVVSIEPEALDILEITRENLDESIRVVLAGIGK